MRAECTHPPDIALTAIRSDQIHVFASFTDACKVDDPRFQAMLEPQELERASRFIFERDRRRHLVTRALARTVLARCTGIAPEDIRFTENPFGRPEIANGAARALDIRFNLSHTADLVVLALARGRDVGIDVETVSGRDVSLDLADRFFSSSEAAALRCLPASARDRRFFDYWTLKEAYIKARGMGLSLSLDKFSFRFTEQSEIVLDIDPDLHDSADRWGFWQFDVPPDYLIALCAERTGTALPQLAFSTVVPFGPLREFQPSQTRRPDQGETADGVMGELRCWR